MHEASALIAGQSVGAAEAVWRGEATHAVNFAGGLHHAMPGSAAGFCVYNDAALAVARLLELGAERVVYVDVDVHHGDGVQAAFWDDPRVLTISLHEHPRTLFPQTGWPEETGGPQAEGGAVNVALPAGTGDAGWLRAFHAVVPELVAAFRPQVVVSAARGGHACRGSAGASGGVAGRAAGGGRGDVTHWRTSTPGGGGSRWAGAGTRWRTWCRGRGRIWWGWRRGSRFPPAAPVPEEWRREVYALTRQLAPLRMADGVRGEWVGFSDGGYDPAARLDQAILATRRAVFPLHGLLP